VHFQKNWNRGRCKKKSWVEHLAVKRTALEIRPVGKVKRETVEKTSKKEKNGPRGIWGQRRKVSSLETKTLGKSAELEGEPNKGNKPLGGKRASNCKKKVVGFPKSTGTKKFRRKGKENGRNLTGITTICQGKSERRGEGERTPRQKN